MIASRLPGAPLDPPDRSGTTEPALVISLGPPTTGPGVTLFESYQQAFGKPTPDGGDHPWVRHEGEILEALFSHEGEEPSPIEELLSGLLREPVRIERYERGIGHHRGLWVGDVWITLSAVRLGSEPLPAWNRRFRELLAAAVGLATQREWIGAVEWSGAG